MLARNGMLWGGPGMRQGWPDSELAIAAAYPRIALCRTALELLPSAFMTTAHGAMRAQLLLETARAMGL